MRRRDFINAIISSAAVWPVSAAAQQPQRMRRIGVILATTADDAEFQAWLGAFLQGLQQSGWSIGQNVRIDTRWATSNPAVIRKHAAELVALNPDVILAHGASTVGPLLQATRTVPIVFAVAADPVGAGFVDSLARPGGNATGFMSFEYGMSGKWLELLKEIAPSVTRAAILRDASQGSGTSQFAAIAAVAPLLKIDVAPVNMRDAAGIDHDIAEFARSPNGGLVTTAGAAATQHRDLIIKYWRRGTSFQQSITNGPSLLPAAWPATGLILSTSTGVPPATSIASSRVKSRPTCRCKSRLSTR